MGSKITTREYGVEICVCWVISVSSGFVGSKNATHEYDTRVLFVTSWLY